MYHLTSKYDRVKPGADVTAMFYVDSDPRCVHCRVVTTSPFVLESTGDQAKAMQPGDRLMLVCEGAGGHSRSVAEVTALREESSVWRIEVQKPVWEDLDKRTYPRHALAVPVRVRAVNDLGDRTELLELEATTVNVSLGGALLSVSRELAGGSLVELNFSQWPAGSRILGIVVRADGPGCAVKFVDFIGSARAALRGLFGEAA